MKPEKAYEYTTGATVFGYVFAAVFMWLLISSAM